MREKDLQETPAVGEQSLLKRFCESSHPAVSLGRDLLWVACVVGGVALLLFAASGDMARGCGCRVREHAP